MLNIIVTGTLFPLTTVRNGIQPCCVPHPSFYH